MPLRWHIMAALMVVAFAACTSVNVPQPGGTVPSGGAGPAPITATPATLVFSSTGASAAQIITLSEVGYSAGFSLRTTCNIVSTSLLTLTSYLVVPLAAGSCVLTFFDTNNQSVNVPVTVTVPGGPTPAPSPSANPGPNPIVSTPKALSFLGLGSALAQTLVLSEPNYSGGFSLLVGCAQAGVAQTNPTTFSIAPLAGGACSLLFGDTTGESILVPVVVTVTNGGGQ
jgi:hypothetical protein